MIEMRWKSSDASTVPSRWLATAAQLTRSPISERNFVPLKYIWSMKNIITDKQSFDYNILRKSLSV